MQLKLFLFFATFTSLTITLVIAFSDISSFSLPSISHQANAAQINLTNYFSEKGQTSSAFAQNFAMVIDSSSQSVLGETQIASNSAKAATSKKSEYKVAVLGDSMIDTLGQNLPHLGIELKSIFPKTKFNFLNYGVGGENIESGIRRLTNDYYYLGEAVPNLLSQNPDIVLVESFAYNHWDNSQPSLDRHWLDIDQIIQTIKKHSSNTIIILISTLGPYCPTYTDGSANLPPERKRIECETVKAYLQNMVNFGTSQKYPLVDVYHASLTGNEGNPKYINQGDHIHPSDEGKKLFAQKVAQILSPLISQ